MRSITFISILGAAALARGADFESGQQKTHLLELFTSEGCSSCPPAEAWFSKLKTEPRLWKDFVPVAFHIDYWDRLGWKDPFSAKEWSDRQSQYSAGWGTDSVYTPGFVLDGRELRSRVVPTASTEKSGVLKVSISNEKLLAEFRPESGTGPFDFYVARLGFDLNTKVSAGENSGRDLHHDFVVLSLRHERMQDGRVEFQIAKTNAPSTAFAAWVTKSDRLEPIQAAGGWMR
jgi:hypothetical protein